MDTHLTESSLSIAIVEWGQSDGISQAMQYELRQQGYRAIGFKHDEPIPSDEKIDIVLTFAPYGRLHQISKQLTTRINRPIYIHWNTENYPNPKLPWPLIQGISSLRAWVDRLNEKPYVPSAAHTLLDKIDGRMMRFRLVGEYRYAMRRKRMDALFESSQLYTSMHLNHGTPARFVHWGTVEQWHEQLNLERDIDVLWMGKRRTKRRSDIIDQVDATLKANGYNMHIADSVIQPFIYADERTKMLNRAKITLNLESESYDNALPYRYHVAAANGSMLVSETLLPHYPIESGVHYVSAEPHKLAETILYYLANSAERQQIANNAVELLTKELTMGNALRQVMAVACELHQQRNPSQSLLLANRS